MMPMSRLLTVLCFGTMACLIAGSAVALNPQPLPPRCLPGAHCGPGIAQPSYQIVHSYNRGESIDRNDWSNAQPVDYRAQHLRAPPRGYEWREVNGQYVLAALATGVILSVILNAGH
jgi:Nickel/cobalt transporter regulator